MRINELLQEFHEELIPGSVLDLGSGDGTNITYLKDLEFTVRGVEKNYGERIEDFIKEPTKPWNNIISFFTLHFLSPTDAKATYQYMKKNTLSGGINMIADFTSDVTWEKGNGFYIKPNGLKEIYSDWKIIHYQEKLVPTRQGSQQMAAFVVAKKL